MSNFTFFHNFFYAICILKSSNSHISHISVVVCSFFEFWTVLKWCIREWVEMPLYRLISNHTSLQSPLVFFSVQPPYPQGPMPGVSQGYNPTGPGVQMEGSPVHQMHGQAQGYIGQMPPSQQMYAPHGAPHGAQPGYQQVSLSNFYFRAQPGYQQVSLSNIYFHRNVPWVTLFKNCWRNFDLSINMVLVNGG